MTDTKTNTTQISDEQVVDYLLNLLPVHEHEYITHLLKTDSDLQARMNVWQNALFDFHHETVEHLPPKRVWDAIDKKLFAEECRSQQRWWHFSWRPALLSLCLVVGVGWYALTTNTYQPSASALYYAALDARFFPIKLWDVEADRKSIAFTSIHDVSEPNRECVAWLKKNSGETIRLGAIPDTGDKTIHRIQLPKDLTAQVGDTIIVGMVDYDQIELPPLEEQHIVTLSDI